MTAKAAKDAVLEKKGLLLALVGSLNLGYGSM